MTSFSKCAAILIFVLLVYTGAVAGQPTRSPGTYSKGHRVAFNIPAQPMDKALIELGQQANQTVIFDAEVGVGIRSRAIRGTYTVAEALAKLLARTGLTFHSVGEATTVVMKSVSADKSAMKSEVRKAQPNVDDAAPGHVPGTDLDMVVVSGTHLKHHRAADSSAKRVYDQEALEQSGTATLAEFAALIPENFNSVNPVSSLFGNTVGTLQQGNNAFLGNGFNLYGMGPEATLTLVDGDRLVSGGASGTFLDLSLLPKDAIASLVTLTGDTAAVYGPDAIAGVVDIRLKTPSANGAETRLRYGIASGGGEQWTLSQIVGARWQSGRALVAFEKTQQNPVLSTDRSYIPVVVPPIDIVPEQRLASLVSKIEQAIAEHTALNALLLVGARRVVDENSGLLGFPLIRESALREFGGTVHLDHTITPDWTVGLYGSYSKLTQSLVSTVPGVEQEKEYGDSSLAEVALNTNAEPFKLYGYPIRLAFGAGMHQETLTVPTSAYHTSYAPLHRNAADTYVEALLPITDGVRPMFRRLELSIAAREDYYEGVGPTFNPKVGLVWSPVSDLSFRTTFASSFRPPTLDELAAIPVYYTVSLPSGSGFTDTLVDQSQGIRRLKPETARTLTGGLDYRRDIQRGWAASMTWFRTVFDDRIATPVVGSPLSDIFSQRELAPFISHNINRTQVQEIFANPAFLYDYAGAGPGSVMATFDNELTNLARTLEEGLEASLRYSGGEANQFGAFFIGNYLLRDLYRSTPNAPAVSLVGNVGQPTKLRARGGMTWSGNALKATLNANFATGYRNTLVVPAQKVGSWTTLDVQLAYRPQLPIAFIQNTRLTLDIRNILNAAPPRVEVPAGLSLLPVGFDPATASPFGRMLSIELCVSW